MSLEPFLAFFLIRYLRKSLRIFAPNPEWDRILTSSQYAVVGLFIIDVVLKTHPVTMWIWYLLLFAITWICLKQPDFSFAKPVIYAVVPLVAISFVSDVIKLVQIDAYNKMENYLNLAVAGALAWMIALLVRSNKQKKALENERRKTREQEERSKFIEGQKDQLEVLVNARTAELTKQKEELQHAITELKATQTQLIQSEKMASLGELTAGIAHEIQNPLNFVNNFSEVSNELLDEMKVEFAGGNAQEAFLIADDVKQNLEKIIYHGKRADSIVKGMLQHSRTSTGQKELTDVNALADEYLRLSYHGLRAKDKSFNAEMKTNFDESIEKINVIAQDVGRVLLNLFNNAFYSVNEKKKQRGEDYHPTVSVSTRKVNNKIEITVEDNGSGIPQKVLDKIYQPFFTTKPTGEGTGLGLSLSYDIITKVHGGKINAETKEGEFAKFIIELPVAG